MWLSQTPGFSGEWGTDRKNKVIFYYTEESGRTHDPPELAGIAKPATLELVPDLAPGQVSLALHLFRRPLHVLPPLPIHCPFPVTGQMPYFLQCHNSTHTPNQAGTTDLYLILAEERWGPWSPEQLAEAILVVLLEKASLEGPQPISIIHLDRTVGSITQNVQGHHDIFTLSSQSTNLYSAHCKHKTCT